MQTRVVTFFILPSLALSVTSLAAEKKPKDSTPGSTPSTLPPTSPMLAVPAAGAGSASGTPSPKIISSEMSGRDLGILTAAVDSGRAQAYFIGLLRAKASSDQIKALAETLRSAQDEENAHLTKLAAQKGWNASMAPTTALKKAGAELDKFAGADFDKATMEKVAVANHDSITAYQNAAQSSDADIKSLATDMLPIAEEKGHIIQKMTGANPKAESDLLHRGSTPTSPAASPAAKPPGKPGASVAPPGPATSANPTPAPAPARIISVVPIATPPSTGATRAVLSPILPSKTPMGVPLQVTTPIPTTTILVPTK